MQPLQKNAKLACHLVLQIRDRGYLDVAIAKKIVSETRKKIQKFVSETCGNQSQEYLVSESWVHHTDNTF